MSCATLPWSLREAARAGRPRGRFLLEGRVVLTAAANPDLVVKPSVRARVARPRSLVVLETDPAGEGAAHRGLAEARGASPRDQEPLTPIQLSIQRARRS